MADVQDLTGLTDLMDLKARTVPLEHLYLDPGNPRLVKAETASKHYPDDAIPDEALQASILSDLKSRPDVGVQDLRDKISRRGFLTIDRVVVRPLKNLTDSYLVLEGNRRIAAAKLLSDPKELMALLPVVRDSLKDIEVMVYEGDDEDIAWEIQGLRHIQSIKEWGPYQQGRYLSELGERRSLRAGEISKLTGLDSDRVAKLLRSFAAFTQAQQDEDYGSQLLDEDFGVFNEAVFSTKKTNLMKWMEWDEKQQKFKNEDALKQLLWLRKDTDTPTKKPRIERQLDIRDKFNKKLLDPKHEDLLESFLSDDVSFDEALDLVAQAESQGKVPKKLADLGAQKDYLRDVSQRLSTLPVPLIVRHDEDRVEFKTILADIAAAAKGAIEVISTSKVSEDGTEP